FPLATPFVDYDYTFAPAVAGGQLSLRTSLYSIHRRTSYTPFAGVHQARHQTRLSSELTWQRRMVSAAGLVASPFVDLRGDVFVTRDLPDPAVPGGLREAETTARLLPAAGLDLRWPWMRTDGLGRHVISPVAQIIAARDEPDEERIGNEDSIALDFSAQRLFLHDRFSGRDRYEGGVRANVGLLYSLYMPRGGFLRASIGQSYHLSGNNSFTMGSGLASDRSDLVSAVAFEPADWLRLSWQGRFDYASLSLRDQVVSASISHALGSLRMDYARLAAAPAYGRPAREEQIFGQAAINLTGRWQLFGSWRYDLARTYTIQRSIGVGFECDCMSLRLTYQENNESEADVISGHSILLSVEFKTLGTGRIGTGTF
ncbi:MAG TPA: LPS-assembly protein LptD, partial [Thermopetrobacter sp.]|nr:LPS-assembly protein LptD [Thermopetrobacter sp.]